MEHRKEHENVSLDAGYGSNGGQPVNAGGDRDRQTPVLQRGASREAPLRT
jgi:hypothetical protein